MLTFEKLEMNMEISNILLFEYLWRYNRLSEIESLRITTSSLCDLITISSSNKEDNIANSSRNAEDLFLALRIKILVFVLTNLKEPFSSN